MSETKRLFKIVQTVDGKMIATYPTDIVEWAMVNNRAISAMSERRASVLRKELQDAPWIQGLYGPMYDGEKDGLPVVRYEDKDTYESLSV